VITDTMWLVWLVSCLVSFLVLEGIALFNRVPNDTLTAVSSHHIPWYIGLFMLIAASVAAAMHWTKAYRSKKPMR